MSRAGKRLESFRQVTKRRPDKPVAPEPWTWKDKLSVWGGLVAVAILGMLPFLDQTIKYRQRIDGRIDHWKADYHLSEDQARQIREIELNHHKAESPVSSEPDPTTEATQAHNRQIAGLMSTEDAHRFLEREGNH